MFDHAWIWENLAAYLAGGLETSERERLEQHTAECPTCAAALAEARAMDAALSGLFAEARPSAALEDRVIQALRSRPASAWRLPVPAWLAVAAAALVLIGFTGAVASQMGSHSNAEASPFAAETPRAEDREATALAISAREKMLGDLNEKERRIYYANNTEPSFSAAYTFSSNQNQLNSMELYSLKENKEEPTQQQSRLSQKKMPMDQPMSEADADAGNFNGKMGMGDGSVRMIPNGNRPAQTYSRTEATDKPPSSPYINVLQPQAGFQPGKLLDELSPAQKPQSSSGMTKDTKKLLARSREAAVENETRQPVKKPPEQQPAGARKIVIRTGEIEYEVQSFDAAVATITRLVKAIKGGFIATVNSDKLANGKVRGSVVVRVPPESLDELIVELRTNLGKSGELKNQRVGSQDITKQYTDLESELRAARAMEERLLQIIKTSKGEIKDLLAVEKELGTWRTRIEKVEGELRYYANQVALSTLTISLYEKEIAAAYGVIEREQVQMGVEVEDVDQAYQAAQKAVREAKGRITRAELKQPSQGQFSALLDFEVAPDAAGPLRDRLKQLGTVARFDISRQEENEGGSGKPSDGKTKRSDTRFHVHFYNLTDVAPRETVFISLACVDVEAAMKTLLARVDKAAGRVVSSNLNSTRSEQVQSDLQFQVKTTLADAVLADIKSAGEVMALQVREITNGETTRKKRGFQVKLWALEAATARETDEVQLACPDVAASYRGVLEAVAKIKGRIRNAQLNEQDRRHVTATLDVDVRRADESVLRAALSSAGAVYTRKVSRAADADNVVDSKVHWQVTFLNQANIPPRETYVFGVEVADVDQTAAMLTALAGEREGRTVEANVARERNGRVTGKLIFDVPLAKVHELLDQLRSAGTVRVQQAVKHPEVPDSPLALARLDVTLSNKELIVPSDDGFGANIHRGLSDSFAVLSWSLRILILGLCVLVPWALVVWAIYRLVLRMRRRSTPTAPAA